MTGLVFELQRDSSGATQSLNIAAGSEDLKKFVEELKDSIENLKLQQEQTQELKEASSQQVFQT